MHTLKKISLWISASVLRLSLFSFALLFAITSVIGHPDTIKESVRNSGIYDVKVSDLATESFQQEGQNSDQSQPKDQQQQMPDQQFGPDQQQMPQTQQFGPDQQMAQDMQPQQGMPQEYMGQPSPQPQQDQQANQDEHELSMDDPIVVNAIDSAISKETIQTSVESVIDGTYAWLKGESEYPDFRLDFTKEKQTFINALADGAVERVSKLPDCSLEQLQSIGDIDPFTVECRPPINLEEQRQKVVEDLNSNADFFADPVIDGQKIYSDFQRRDSSQMSDRIPGFVQWLLMLPLISDRIPGFVQLLLMLPLIFAGLGLLSLLGVVFLSDGKREAAKKIGRILVGVGIFILVTEIIFVIVSGKISTPNDADLNPQLKDALLKFVYDLRWKLARPAIIIASSYTAVGISVLAFLHFHGKKQVAKQETDNAKTAEKPKIDKESSETSAQESEAERQTNEAAVDKKDGKKPDDNPTGSTTEK